MLLDSRSSSNHPTFPIRPIYLGESRKDVRRMAGGKALSGRARLLAAAIAALALAAALGSGTAAAASKPSPPIAPTKALCKGKTYKIGYDVFSGTQPFANLVTKGLKDAAKKLGCVTVVTTVDNLNGPVAVGNIKTLLNQNVDGIVDFQVLAPFQPAIAKLLNDAKVPGVSIVGADLPGWPSVGADNYGASVLNGHALAAAAKEVYPDLPTDHIVRVDVDGTESDSYNKTLSALSRVPADAVVLLTGVNDEVTHGTYKAAGAKGLKNYLVNSFGGDPYGLNQVCADRKHYVGALFLLPEVWGSSALAVVLREINGMKVPKEIGIKGVEVTASNPIAGCK
jgi:ABC-type sugar transport system substrate-binding protein